MKLTCEKQTESEVVGHAHLSEVAGNIRILICFSDDPTMDWSIATLTNEGVLELNAGLNTSHLQTTNGGYIKVTKEF